MIFPGVLSVGRIVQELVNNTIAQMDVTALIIRPQKGVIHQKSFQKYYTRGTHLRGMWC